MRMINYLLITGVVKKVFRYFKDYIMYYIVQNTLPSSSINTLLLMFVIIKLLMMIDNNDDDEYCGCFNLCLCFI